MFLEDLQVLTQLILSWHYDNISL